jgi:hypothetical protein
MHKSTLLGALLAPFACPQALAQDWRGLPGRAGHDSGRRNELVSPGHHVASGAHARILPGEDFTDIRIRFLGPLPDQINPCVRQPATIRRPAIPMPMGKLDFRLRNQPTGAPDDATASIQPRRRGNDRQGHLDLAYLGMAWSRCFRPMT